MTIAPLSVDEFKLALPEKVKKTINQELVDRVNAIIESPETMEVFKDNLLSYTSVVSDGRFKVENYINAVLFVSFKMHGSTDRDAYIKTFPEKYKRFLAEKIENKVMASYTSAYKKSKLVTLLMAQCLTPFLIVNANARQRALNKQLSIMDNDEASFKVQVEAANSVLTHLKPPDEGKTELDIPTERGDIIGEYEKVMNLMVQKQKELILANPGSILAITNAPIKPQIKEAVVTSATTVQTTPAPVTIPNAPEERLFK